MNKYSLLFVLLTNQVVILFDCTPSVTNYVFKNILSHLRVRNKDYINFPILKTEINLYTTLCQEKKSYQLNIFSLQHEHSVDFAHSKAQTV